jgi:hypothetical protein
MKKLGTDYIQGTPITIQSRNFCVPLCFPKIYTTIILPAVMNGCEISSLTLRKKCRLRMLENRLLRKIFGPTRDKVMGLEGTAQEGASKYVLHTKYYPGDQTKNKLDRACGTYGAEERSIQGFGGDT